MRTPHRLYRNGRPVPISTLGELLERCTPDSEGCLMYPKTAHRYGIVKTVYGRFTTHRAAYVLATGMHPGPLYVLHKCDKPGCCNPDHLYVGTQFDNMQDRVRRAREQAPSPIRSLTL